MRNINIIIITVILYNILPLNPYVECNKLNIIKKISITCNNEYEIEYQEIIPQKEENGINYLYKYYVSSNKELNTAIKNIEKNKNIYKDKAKIIINNC